MFKSLRLLALLRRIAKALEAANELERERQRLEFRELRGKQKIGRIPRVVGIDVPMVSDWNKKWEEDHPEAS